MIIINNYFNETSLMLEGADKPVDERLIEKDLSKAGLAVVKKNGMIWTVSDGKQEQMIDLTSYKRDGYIKVFIKGVWKTVYAGSKIVFIIIKLLTGIVLTSIVNSFGDKRVYNDVMGKFFPRYDTIVPVEAGQKVKRADGSIKRVTSQYKMSRLTAN